MNLPVIEKSLIKKWIRQGHPLIDVRAPCEFQQGAIPGSVNLPILQDAERAQVGTMYKQSGQEAAIALGHTLVGGGIKSQRVQLWRDFCATRPEDVAITCFRGGLRSRTAQQWLYEAGLRVPRLEGGYKFVRQMFLEAIENFAQTGRLLVISGPTGSGKTILLREIARTRPILDLERAAQHRGSAFGALAEPQPSQASFENHVARQLLAVDDEDREPKNSEPKKSGAKNGEPKSSELKNSEPIYRTLLVEDESRLIGSCVLPESLFNLLRNSPVIVLEEGLPARVETTFADYVLHSPLAGGDELAGEITYQSYQRALMRITKKLGGLRTQKAQELMAQAWSEQKRGRGLDGHRQWIEFLLREYYDPMYLGSLDKRSPQVVFRGSRAECRDFLLCQEALTHGRGQFSPATR